MTWSAKKANGYGIHELENGDQFEGKHDLGNRVTGTYFFAKDESIYTGEFRVYILLR